MYLCTDQNHERLLVANTFLTNNNVFCSISCQESESVWNCSELCNDKIFSFNSAPFFGGRVVLKTKKIQNYNLTKT